MTISKTRTFLGLVAVVLIGTSEAMSGPQPADAQWKPLFDGKTLQGWEVLEDEGKFFVEDGAIVGETTPQIKGSYLCTKETYDNFILELEFKIDEGINSGVQIRTDTYKQDTTTLYLTGSLKLVSRTFKAGQIFGYQIEIDTSPRAWTGGLYEEGRRGWLQTLEYHESARKAFKQGQWNKLRIQAAGDSIKTWLNGVLATDTHDAWCRTGRIGLQLHGTKDAGKQVRWRDLRIQCLK